MKINGIRDGIIIMNMKSDLLIQAILNRIEDELCRQYWNKNQEDMMSPFQNTGNEYSNDTFTVRAHYWGDDEDRINLPNFEYKNFKCYWYKHSMRSLCWYYNNIRDVIPPLEFLNAMLNDCFDSMERDFHKGGN